MEVDHRIYLTMEAKLAALALDASALLRQPCAVVVTTHFRASLSANQETISSAGLTPLLFRTPFDQDALNNALLATEPSLILTMADLLPLKPLGPPPTSASRPLAWLVSEHYPTQAGDDAILAAARSVPGSRTVRFYDSLDGAFFSRHGSQQVRGIWPTLGLQDDQYLSHPMIARTIREAQKKIAQRVRSPLSAHSPEAWFQQNLP